MKCWERWKERRARRKARRAWLKARRAQLKAMWSPLWVSAYDRSLCEATPEEMEEVRRFIEECRRNRGIT